MRTVALILLGCAAVGVSILVGLMLWLGVGTGLAVGLAIVAVVVSTYLLWIGPRQRRWGVTEEEVRRSLPGDELLGPDAASTTRAMTVDAHPEEVFT